ncbi:hypothetical protein [Paludisphaera borealis]|uniref:Uncharacterized protein n=1 Tax=Paludisphaera borealis TaxID=1387353 RepID=A0A1U7CK20_9BACT|nr:hypothetical protein [Paludisphaera borealis]APW59233.1 hypothetical protein BSF38_00649 [Paludisphaera borealis]
MTFRHLATTYCAWVWHQWSRLSAFFFTTCVVVALTIGLAQTTRQYNLLYSRVQASFHRQEQAGRLQSARSPDIAGDRVEARRQAEVVQLLERILARLPEGQATSVSTPGPLSSSH